MFDLKSLSTSTRNLISILVIFILCAIGYLLLIADQFGMSAGQTLSSYMNGLYFPWNGAFNSRRMMYGNGMTFFGGFVFLTTIISITYFVFFRKPKTGNTEFPLSNIFISVGIISFLVFAPLQQYERIRYNRPEDAHMHHLDPTQRLHHVFGKLYLFTSNAKALLAEPCEGKIIIADGRRDPTSIAKQMVLRYHLYPHIKENNDRDAAPDCLVLHSERNVMDRIPDPYMAILTTDKARLALAVRKDKLK